MVKRRKQEDIAGVLEFAGRSAEDPEVIAWLAEHKSAGGGKIRLGKGATGLRVMFSEESDMAAWRTRAAAAGKKTPAA